MSKNPATCALYPPRPALDIGGSWLTLAAAREDGYTESGERTKQAGYVSRRGDIEKSVVFIAGKGKRSGQLYYLAPAYDSTLYCWRVYLVKRGARL